MHWQGLGLVDGQGEAEEELVPGEDEGEEEGDDEAGDGEGEGDAEEGAVAGGSIDHRGFLDFDGEVLEVIAQEPDDQRQIHGGVDGDEDGDAVEEPDAAEEEEVGDDQGDGGHHALGDEPEGDVVVAPAAIAESAEGVGGHGAEDDGEESGEKGGAETVAEEARNVARLTNGKVLAGPFPKEQMLREIAGSYQLLHLACHGEFDPVTPLDSALDLAPGESLTAVDVLRHLRLSCELVTLSVCESGLSRVRRGDELVGLVRAFMHAGAPALVTTLWRVDDRATLILMEKFYQEIQNGLSLGESLKRAQLFLKNLTRQEEQDAVTRLSEGRDDAGAAQGATEWTAVGRSDERPFSDPYYWAPFILVGSRQAGIQITR